MGKSLRIGGKVRIRIPAVADVRHPQVRIIPRAPLAGKMLERGNHAPLREPFAEGQRMLAHGAPVEAPDPVDVDVLTSYIKTHSPLRVRPADRLSRRNP